MPTPIPIVERKNPIMMPVREPSQPPTTLPASEPMILKVLLISGPPRRRQLRLLAKGEDLAALRAHKASGGDTKIVQLGELRVLAGRIAPRFAQLLRTFLLHGDLRRWSR